MNHNPINGRCHCGNISYELQWPVRHPLVGRACDCDYCTMQGAVWTSHPEAPLKLRFQQPNAVVNYRFGHQTAVFKVCASCGIVPVATCTPQQPQLIAVININTFVDVDIAGITQTPTSFDSENKTSRLQRRQRNWSPVHMETA